VEYARLGGSGRLPAAAFSSVHVYMLPVGGLLALGAAFCGVRCWQAWWMLGRRLEQTRRALGDALRNRRSRRPRISPGRSPSEGAQLLALWLPLSLLQVGLYLVQENGEALVSGRALPGLGAVLGVHSVVLLVHVLVAWALAWGVLLVLHSLGDRRDRVDACERLLLVLLRRLGRAAAVPHATRALSASPIDRLGRGIWCRPPPALLTV
jgi:hypothetical protein